MNAEDYLRLLIQRGSRGRLQVVSHARGLQFFIVRGGAEGFLSRDLTAGDPSHVEEQGGLFNYEDLLAVFSAEGRLVGSSKLKRPLRLAPDPAHGFGGWSQGRAEAVYRSWDGRDVGIYYNTNFVIQRNGHSESDAYWGLKVDDPFRARKGEDRVVMDIHKLAYTLGCVMLDDPRYEEKRQESGFSQSAYEPPLIRAVLRETKGRPAERLGVLRVLDLARQEP
jgi:hypothetical protein